MKPTCVAYFKMFENRGLRQEVICEVCSHPLKLHIDGGCRATDIRDGNFKWCGCHEH